MQPGCAFSAVDSLGGGAFPLGTYFITMTYLSVTGESTPSVEQPVVLYEGNAFEVTAEYPSIASMLRFYITATNGLLGNRTFYIDVEPNPSIFFISTLPTYKGSPPAMTTSRRSKVIRIYAPLIPNPPILDPTQPINPDAYSNPGNIQYWFTWNGDVRNVYGLEIRASDNQTVLLQRAIASPYDMIWTLSGNTQRSVELFVYFINSMGEYSEAFDLTTEIEEPTAPNISEGPEAGDSCHPQCG